MDSGSSRLRTVAHRILLGLALALGLAVTLLVVRLAPLLLAPNDYAGVASIEHDPAYRDPALLRAAWSRPVARRYVALPYEFQRNQSLCGPTSVADVLHSLGDARSQEQVLAGSSVRPWFGYLLGGLTLDQAADLAARSSGGTARVLRGQSLTQFRGEMQRVNDSDRRVIVNFHRGPLFGRGHGHFSPLLAYLPDRDLVLVGDVNRDYRPFLVATERLWRAVNAVDSDTGKMRGLVVLTARSH